ncbi:MAG: transcriptional regulator TyrR [Gammaproteobacteria bacterium]|nr:transcriptional regulator TyrR [Gammaproteobacteria bacterium]
MRLQIACQDRVGLAKEVLNILVEYEIDLKGIEFDKAAKCLYVAFPQVAFDSFQKVMAAIRRVEGVSDVKTTSFLPNEREHNELVTLLKILPDGVISIDNRGNVVTANQASLVDLGRAEEEVIGQPLQSLLKGFNFSRWLEKEEVLSQTLKLSANNEEFVTDLLPINVTDEEGNVQLVGAVVNLKSHTRLGQQINAFRDDNNESFVNILANSTAMRRVIREAKKMSQLEAPLLIQGETGTGKELIARACHDASERSEKPFLALSCASLPDNVAESELFGYGPNAYPGSDEVGKRGIFELADGGTVFLDEVGEMSTELQTKLLRFLQDGTFRRVADENEVKVDVRVICSTQKDLANMVQEHTFREDLYYRLNVLSIHIPPLRERKQDILPLAQHFMQRFANEVGKTTPTLSKNCMDYLQNYPWPGNTRQLENAVYRAISLLDSDIVEKEMLELPTYTNEFGYLEKEFEGSLEQAVKRFEAGLLRKLYPAYPSSRQLAKKLGLSHTAIANKLREYGINKKSIKV